MSLSRRARITWLSIAGGVALLLLVAVVLAYVMLRPERFTRTLRNAARSAGLELTLTSPAHASLWPKPGVQLEGLQLFVQGHADPVLIASHGMLVVPWRTLLGGPIAITRLELDSPRLDLDQLRAALARMSSGSGAAPRLPAIDTGASIRDGTLVSGNAVLLQNVNIQTGALKPGKVFTLDLDASRRSGRVMSVQLHFTPKHPAKSGIDLEDIALVARSGHQARLEMTGHALWQGGSALDLALAGTLYLDDQRAYRLAVDSVAGSNAPPGLLRMKLDGPASHIDMRLSPGALANWWQTVAGNQPPGPLPQPPMDGSIQARRIDLGPLKIKGLELRSGDAVPAASGSTPTPAEGRP